MVRLIFVYVSINLCFFLLDVAQMNRLNGCLCGPLICDQCYCWFSQQDDYGCFYSANVFSIWLWFCWAFCFCCGRLLFSPSFNIAKLSFQNQFLHWFFFSSSLRLKYKHPPFGLASLTLTFHAFNFAENCQQNKFVCQVMQCNFGCV